MFRSRILFYLLVTLITYINYTGKLVRIRMNYNKYHVYEPTEINVTVCYNYPSVKLTSIGDDENYLPVDHQVEFSC